MPLAETMRVARVCGATHVAVGAFRESAGKSEVSYDLYRVGEGDAKIGTFSCADADKDALVRKLPLLAKELHRALGVVNSANPVAAPLQGVNAEVLTTLGACADTTTGDPNLETFLRETGKKVPLAAGLAVFIPALRAAPKDAAPYAGLLLKSMPLNTQAVGSLGYAVPGAISVSAPALYALSDRYRENYLLAHAATWVARTRSDWNRDVVYSTRGAQNAPANPDARLSAGWSLSTQANNLRQGRQAGDMSAAMMVKTVPLYMQWLAETKAATQCDPLYGKAYQRLASAATFAGDRDEADAAMTMARKLNADSPYDTYQWALEMYQPKWGGDPARLLEVATEAADASYNSNNETLEIYHKLGQLQFTSLKQKMGDRLILESEKTLAANPKDMYARHLHGSLSHDRGKRRDALADFEANAQNYPADAAIQFDLGKHYIARSQFDKAEAPLRKSIALRPRDAETLHYLAYALKHQKKPSEAQKYAEAAVAVTPDYADALALLGTVHLMQDRVPEAIRYYERSLRVRPFQPEACINLGACYNYVGRAADAIQLGNQFLRYYPENMNMFRVLGEAYARNGDWVESEGMNRAVLQRSPDDANAHAYLGDALWGQKKPTEARDEWQAAVRIGSPEEPVKHAKAQLKKYPAR
jgi:tetratricopeptide (TPR) repeat protein